jgi:hypothetical protein
MVAGFLLILVTVGAAMELAGCGGSLVDRGLREACYAQAEAKAQAAVDAQCADRPFPECPSADAIVAQLKADQESCP